MGLKIESGSDCASPGRCQPFISKATALKRQLIGHSILPSYMMYDVVNDRTVQLLASMMYITLQFAIRCTNRDQKYFHNVGISIDFNVSTTGQSILMLTVPFESYRNKEIYCKCAFLNMYFKAAKV